MTAREPTPLFEVQGLAHVYPRRRAGAVRLGSVPLRLDPSRAGAVAPGAEHVALQGLSFSIARGETLALVGESGSGKSTVGRALLRLLQPRAGRVLYRRTDESAPVDLLSLNRAELRAVRRELAIVFQDPYQSLNPRLTIGQALTEPLVVHGIARGREAEARAARLLARVGLADDALRRFPHEFSGGQRQRIAIARALALGPRFVVLDEAVSALDVSIQAQVLDLLQELRSELGLTYLFITHDLALVRTLAERVVVLERGRIVESGATAEVLARPAHAATRALLASVPSGDPRRRLAGLPPCQP